MKGVRRRKYAQKLFVTYSAALLVLLFVLLCVLWGIGFREQYKSSAETQRQLVSKTQEQIDASLQGMDRIVSGLLFNQTFLQIMADPNAPLYYTDYSNQVLDTFIMLDAPLFPSHRIIAFNRTNYYNLSKSGEESNYIREALADYAWYDQATALNGQRLILPVHQDPFETEEYPVYSVVRSVTDGTGVYGIIEVQNDYAQLAEFCEIDPAVGSIVLFSDTGSVMYPWSTETAGSNYEELYRAVEENRAQNGDALNGSFLLGTNEVVYSRSDYSNWTTVFLCPVTAATPYVFQLTILTFAAFLAIASISLFMIFLITKHMTAPLVSLSQSLSKVSLDHLAIELPECGIEEIEQVNQAFEIMFRDLKNAIAASIQSRAGEERANYLALQSQMNPHTIYNTIGMIESVSYMNGDHEVSNLCICFSHMLRYISDYSRSEYTVLDEITHLRNYATLTEKRYEGMLAIRVEVDESLRSRQLPKFTLQPLVENSVKHGMNSGGQPLHIEVSVCREEKGWSVTIADDGSGFEPEKLGEIQRQLAGCDDTLRDGSDILNRHIGNLALVNIYMRCRILYGDAFVWKMGNRPEGGAFVTLWFGEEKQE